MFFLDSQNCITQIGGSLTDRLGTDADQLLGTDVANLVTEEDAVGLLRAIATVRDASATESQRVSCRLLGDSETIPVVIELCSIEEHPRLGNVLGTVEQDRTPGTRDEPESKWMHLQSFIEVLDDAGVVFEMRDSEPIIRAVNSAFEEAFGYHAEFIVDEPLNHYIVPDRFASEAAMLDRHMTEGAIETAVVTRRTASGNKQFSYRGLPVDSENGRQYGIAIYADISEQRQNRQHLKVLHRVLRHNLRNELTVILGMAEEISNRATSEGVREAAERIASRAEKLESVSEKARIAENVLGESPSETVVDVGQIAEHVVSETRERYPEVTITSDIQSPLPVATGVEIRDALQNLVDNAIEHNTGDAEVHVSTRTETPIHPSTRASGRRVVITVDDNGPGIPKQERAVIFDDEDMTQLKHGSGLGLWVVRWITESAGGSLTYDRTNGRTSVEISLPLMPATRP